MSTGDPRRLLDPAQPLEPELRALLEAGHRDMPSPQQLASLSARLAPRMGEPSATQASPQLAGPGAWVAPWTVPALAGLLVALLGTGALLLAREPRIVESAAAAPSTPSTRESLAAADSPGPAPTDSRALSAADDLEREADPDTAPSGPEPAASERASSASASVRTPAPAPTRTARKGPPDASGRDPFEELVLLDEAQRVLVDDPARALSRTTTHRTRFPRGTYEQEREVIAIDALFRLGQRDRARRRAQHFLRTYPGSSHTRRVKNLLGA